MKKRFNRALSVLLVVMMVVSTLPTAIFAEEAAHDHEAEAEGGIELLAGGNYNFQDWAVGVSASGDTVTESNGVLTVTATAATTAQIVITNYLPGAEQGLLSFKWAASNVSDLVIDGQAVSASSGSFSKLLAAKGSVTVTFGSGTLTMSDFAVKAPQEVSAITFDYDSAMGSVSVDGISVATGETKSITVAGATLTAAPVSGASFLAWTDGDDNVLSREAAFTLIPAEDMTVKAVFANSTSPGYYLAGGTKLFTDLNQAATFAKSNGNQTVVLLNDTTLPAGSYTIPAEVTFLIPFDAGNTLYTDTPVYVNGYTRPTAYRTLTMASGARLVVRGKMSLSAQQSYQNNYNGAPIGPVSFVKMEKGSSITVKENAFLYVWGYITGEGSVTAESNATVYECFQVTDWRGGNASFMMYEKRAEYRVFPLSQYYVQNIEVPLTLEAGAEEVGYMALTALGQVIGSPIPFIGEAGMFKITDGSVVKDYDEQTDRLKMTVNGELAMSYLRIESNIANMDSREYELPINGNITVEVESGNIQVNQNIAFLPGAELVIREGASCTFSEGYSMYVYA